MAAQRLLQALTSIALLWAAALAWGQGGAITGQVINNSGYPAANVPVRVCGYTSTGNPCTPLSTIYADPYLSSPIGNPTATDNYGNYSFFVPTGYYIVQIVPSSGVTYSYLVSSSGSASVYSVGLTMPAIFTVTGSPITGGGTLAVTLASQAQDLVFASPASGSGLPSFLALTTAYLPFTYTGSTSKLATASGVLVTGDGGKWDASGNLVDTGGPAGTVTSIGLTTTAPFLSIGSSPVTGNGSISLTFGATGTGADVVTATAAGTSGHCAQWASGNLGATASACATVTSVAVTVPAQMTVSGSPVTTAGTIALGINGTGNGTKLLTGTGTYTPGDEVVIDANGNVIDSGNVEAGIDDYFTATSCSQSSGSNLQVCYGTITFTAGGNTNPSFAAMPDTGYWITCPIHNASQEPGASGSSNFITVYNITTSGFAYSLNEVMGLGQSSTVPFTVTLMCHLHHN